MNFPPKTTFALGIARNTTTSAGDWKTTPSSLVMGTTATGAIGTTSLSSLLPKSCNGSSTPSTDTRGARPPLCGKKGNRIRPRALQTLSSSVVHQVSYSTTTSTKPPNDSVSLVAEAPNPQNDRTSAVSTAPSIVGTPTVCTVADDSDDE